MNDSQIVVGSVVKLRSGGPDMTVDKIAGHQVFCSWMTKADKKENGFFEMTSLKLVDS